MSLSIHRRQILGAGKDFQLMPVMLVNESRKSGLLVSEKKGCSNAHAISNAGHVENIEHKEIAHRMAVKEGSSLPISDD